MRRSGKSPAWMIAAGLWLAASQSAVAQTSPEADGSILPFPRKPSTSIAGPTLQQSKLVPFPADNRLPKDAPNILIIMLDDVGFGLPDTFGGPVHTPTLSRLANDGISYNTFHTTSICSPTRAALLTGRNHQRVGSGTIAERAVNWDGYTGVIPRTSATHRQGARQLRLQHRSLRQMAQHAGDRKRPRWARSRCGRPARASASIISTASSPARRRNGNRV